jgi:hypothetical protein
LSRSLLKRTSWTDEQSRLRRVSSKIWNDLILRLTDRLLKRLYSQIESNQIVTSRNALEQLRNALCALLPLSTCPPPADHPQRYRERVNKLLQAIPRSYDSTMFAQIVIGVAAVQALEVNCEDLAISWWGE